MYLYFPDMPHNLPFQILLVFKVVLNMEEKPGSCCTLGEELELHE